MLLSTSDAGFLIPAHIWTPWFSLFGSKSGFDSIEACFEDLAGEIFACRRNSAKNGGSRPLSWRSKTASDANSARRNGIRFLHTRVSLSYSSRHDIEESPSPDGCRSCRTEEVLMIFTRPTIRREKQMTDPKRIETVALENGLELELYDESRRMAGDRWLVCIAARVAVDVKRVAEDLSLLGIDPEMALRRLGSAAVYEHRVERRFVDEKERGAVLTSEKDALLKTIARYIAKRSFATRLVLKQYREAEEKAKWYSEDTA
jgi:hypothetical protein